MGNGEERQSKDFINKRSDIMYKYSKKLIFYFDITTTFQKNTLVAISEHTEIIQALKKLQLLYCILSNIFKKISNFLYLTGTQVEGWRSECLIQPSPIQPPTVTQPLISFPQLSRPLSTQTCLLTQKPFSNLATHRPTEPPISLTYPAISQLGYPSKSGYPSRNVATHISLPLAIPIET